MRRNVQQHPSARMPACVHVALRQLRRESSARSQHIIPYCSPSVIQCGEVDRWRAHGGERAPNMQEEVSAGVEQVAKEAQIAPHNVMLGLKPYQTPSEVFGALAWTGFLTRASVGHGFRTNVDLKEGTRRALQLCELALTTRALRVFGAAGDAPLV
eukprot:366124-Chlamydomonas_euryale.AAC.19